MSKIKENLAVVVFRNNLRLEDNLPLYKSCESFNNVVGLYPLEILQGVSFGFKKYGRNKKEFLYQSILNLKKNLLVKNIMLYCIADIKQTLQKLDQDYNLTLYFESEVGTLEKRFEEILQLYTHKSYFQQTMIKPFDFDYTKSFSHFRKKAKNLTINEPIGSIDFVKNNTLTYPIENVTIQLQNISTVCKGGEDEAHQRVHHYFENYLHSYIDTRALINGKDISTCFSPYLSVGAISPRTIYKLLKSYEQKSYSSKSSYWIYFELLWRDFFHLVMKQSENRLFLKKGLNDFEYNFKNDNALLQSFVDANTGIDVIDDGINELKSSGWISNRQRQLLANFFCKILGLDFRYGAAFFEKYLIDYNPASNYGNWAYQAGVGNDKSYRVFDLIDQAKRYGAKEQTGIESYLKTKALEVKKNIYKISENVK